MISNVGFSRFRDAFNRMGREDQFSHDGLKALFDYLEMLEDDCGFIIKLDVIALCCEYTEYESLEDVAEAYSLDDISDHTTVITFNTGVIIQDF